MLFDELTEIKKKDNAQKNEILFKMKYFYF